MGLVVNRHLLYVLTYCRGSQKSKRHHQRTMRSAVGRFFTVPTLATSTTTQQPSTNIIDPLQLQSVPPKCSSPRPPSPLNTMPAPVGSVKRNRDDEDEKVDEGKPNDEAPAKKKPSQSPAPEIDNPKDAAVDGDDLGSVAGTNPTPIFLKKTYIMVDSCDPDICTWNADGLSFVVKDPDKFASDIIPQYFDHKKFSSFARQLNCKFPSIDIIFYYPVCTLQAGYYVHCRFDNILFCLQSMVLGKSKLNPSRTQIMTRLLPSMVSLEGECQSMSYLQKSKLKY